MSLEKQRGEMDRDWERSNGDAQRPGEVLGRMERRGR
jgi:hypothetical protein